MHTSLRSTLALTASLMFGLSACGPTPTTPRPSPTPTATPTPSPTPTATATPGPTPTATPPMMTGQSFSAQLTGGQESPPVNSSATGSVSFVLNEARTEARIDVTTAGLSGPITGAHVHQGSAGANGAVVKDLTVRGNVVSAVWRNNDSQPLSEALINSLLTGGLYVNVHTAAHPNGEIRGQLISTTDMLFPVYLSSSQEVPPVMSGGSGTALVRVRSDRSAVTLEGTVHNLSGEITGAHFHKAGAGANGDVVKDITVSGNSLSATWSRNDGNMPLTDALLNDLLSGQIYINVHTPIHPNGEMRGQITAQVPNNLVSTHFFSSEMRGANEVPVVLSNALGAVEVKLSPENQEVMLEAYTSGLSGPITGAHIHRGIAGVNGEVVKSLSVNGNQITGTWRMNDASEPLTASLMTQLLTGGLYVNAHTSANPGGEIRGQLLSTVNSVYAVGLSGSAEVPAVNTNGQGAAWVTLSPDRREVKVMGQAHNLTGAITGAHIHSGPAGLSGPVVKDLSVVGDTFSVTWGVVDQAQPLTPALVTEMLAGNLYINLHTAAHPNGEVRAQIR